LNVLQVGPLCLGDGQDGGLGYKGSLGRLLGISQTFFFKSPHIRYTKMGIPGDIGVPATENLRLYLSQATLPLMKIPRNAPPLPPSGHRSHNIGLTTRPERHRRLQSVRALRRRVEAEVSECMYSQSSFPNASVLNPNRINNTRLKQGSPRLSIRRRRFRFGVGKCDPHPLQPDL